MVFGVYSIRDKYTGFMQPSLDVNDQAAVRNFANAIKSANDGSIMAFAPADFDLYKLGTFDSDKGIFETQIPEFIIAGSTAFGGNNEIEV